MFQKSYTKQQMNIIKDSWIRDRLPTPVFLGFPGASAGKESTCNAGDPGLIPGSGRLLWRRNRLPTPVFLGFPGGSAGKAATCNAETPV